MNSVSSYIVGLIACALMCGAVNSLFDGKKATHSIIRVMTGVVMSIVVIGPLTQFRLQDVDSYFDDISISSQAITEQGKSDAKEAMSSIIKENTQAYILDKASEFGLVLQVEVQMDDANTPAPEMVYLTGEASIYNRQRLGDIIESQLAIAKEHQIWN